MSKRYWKAMKVSKEQQGLKMDKKFLSGDPLIICPICSLHVRASAGYYVERTEWGRVVEVYHDVCLNNVVDVKTMPCSDCGYNSYIAFAWKLIGRVENKRAVGMAVRCPSCAGTMAYHAALAEATRPYDR